VSGVAEVDEVKRPDEPAGCGARSSLSGSDTRTEDGSERYREWVLHDATSRVWLVRYVVRVVVEARPARDPVACAVRSRVRVNRAAPWAGTL